MASDLDYVLYVCEQAEEAGKLTYRKMFGEYALYLRGKVIAFICDNQLFVKPTKAGLAVLEKPTEGFPYPGAKPHWLIESELDDPSLLSRLFLATESEVPLPKPKKPGAKKRKATPDS